MQIHDKMQREFINIAAHELRTPIQPIIGLADILQNDKAKIGADQQQEFLAAIARNARRLHKLAEDILDVARIDSQNLKLERQKINLTEFLPDIIMDFVPYKIPTDTISYCRDAISAQQEVCEDDNKKLEARASTPKVIFDCKENLDLYVMGDVARLTQVIHNLLTNAIESCGKKGGSISVRLKRETLEDRQLCAIVSVKDDGRGIDEDMLVKLFSKFATKSEKGLGLGLFISKGIIESHGGRIWVENNHGEKGATFTFALPLMDH
jgi:signal transduction histidine kinase